MGSHPGGIRGAKRGPVSFSCFNGEYSQKRISLQRRELYTTTIGPPVFIVPGILLIMLAFRQYSVDAIPI